MSIDKVNKALGTYIKGNISPQFQIVSVKKNNDEWNATAEIYEASEFIQTIGLKTSAKDKNLYTFQLDEKFEILGYEKQLK